VNLPKCPNNYTLGTTSATRKGLDDVHLSKEAEICLDARLERERQEEKGLADQEEFIQETTWPVDKLSCEFKLQICWKYFEEDNQVSEKLKWCGGVVQKLVYKRTEQPNYIDELVLWDDECMEPRMDNPTQERLKKKDHNPKNTITVAREPI
jgi:hypothetical protein